MSNPPVSVIIPFSPAHTSETYLEEAKESVNNQSVPTETIVVEDTEQRGPSWARNKGFERASTRFVALLDADDLWEKGKLSAQIGQLKKTGAGICIEGDYNDTQSFMRDLFLLRTSSLTSSILLDTERTHVRFEEALERREDHLFILEAASQAGACFVPNIVEIRKHQGGLSSRNTPNLRIEQNELFIEYVAQRVDETLARENENELFRYLYHRVGRSEHYQGNYRSAVGYFFLSLRQGISIKTLGALILSTGGYFRSKSV
jgi:glycosyltransferase involved in cell wall biosynthesis